MNRIYRIVWSNVFNAWIAVSENAKGRGKRSSKRKLILTALALSVAPLAQAAPTGGQVVSGSGTIAQTGSTTNIQQTTQNLSLNWQSFNVAQTETVNFLQPSATAIAVNRIFDTNGSQILGHLNANGQVWLINPNGVLFGQGAQVNVGGLVASTLDFNDASLGSGSVSFSGTGTGSIINQGTINAANGGYVALLGNHVSNQGTIVAQLGTVALGAGSAATLTFSGSSLVHMQVDQSTLNNLAENGGLIKADGGQILLTAGAQNAVLASVVNNTGILEANTVNNQNGTIILSGGMVAGTVNAGGTIDVSSATANGGQIIATANNVIVADNATLNATGATGGGTINIGGGWQGRGGIAQATTVYVSPTATLNASATNNGNGGLISVWSDVTNVNSTTNVYGTLLALGGVNGGNGGNIETSGHQVDINGVTVNAGAASGSGGTWLIDPYSYTISTSQASTIVGSLNSGTDVTVDTSANVAGTGSSGNSTDMGDITVTAPINKTLGTDATLTLKATRNIILQSGATFSSTSNKLNLQFWADSGNIGTGIIVDASTSIGTNGGWVKFGGNQTATINGTSMLVGGDVFFNGASAQDISTAGGALDIYGQTIISNTSGLTFNTNGGNVNLWGQLDSGNQYAFVAVSSGGTWYTAQTAAINGTGGGSAVGDSYLVNITSRLENSLAGIAANYQGAWIGAYRPNYASYAWVWANGPEAGKVFFNQNTVQVTTASNGTATTGSYQNFGNGEPNGCNTSSTCEGFGQFFGAAGQWNDLSSSTTYSATQVTPYSVLGYVRETNLASSPLTINAGTGTVTIAGAVGSNKALSSLTVNAASTAVNGTSLITTGAQTYNNALTVISSSTFHLSGSSLAITNANQALSITATGDVTIDSPSSVAGPISIYGGNINLNSNLASTASGAAILLSASGNITTANVAKTITTNNGNISLIGDANAVGVGALDLDYETLSAGTGNVLVRGKTFGWTVSPTASPTISSTTGTFTFESSDASFGQGVDVGWFNLPSTLSGLTIGKSTNTQNISVSTYALSVAGPISMYGSNIIINSGATLTSTAGTQGILLKATGGITDNANLTTNGGDITLWANSAGAITGGIQVSNGVTLSSTGGWITLGGSANNATISGLPTTSTNRTTLPQGYAENMTGTMGGVTLGTYIGGTGQNAAVSINSGNGNISIAGQSTQYASNYSYGVNAYSGVNVNSGSGNITVNGLSTGATTGGYDFGFSLANWFTNGTNALSKWQTAGGTITLNGTASGATSTGGVNVGADFGGSASTTSTLTIEDTATGGGITVNGSASGAATSNTGIRSATANLLSNSGAISLNSITAGNPYSIISGYTATLGYLAGSDVQTSSANIAVTAGALTTSGALNINSTGTLTVQPYSTSFSSVLDTTNLTLASTISALTLGKAGNTADITVASATSIAGPINIYGGNINLNANLTSTLAGAAILAKASGNITTAASTTFQTNNGDLIFWSNSGNLTSGATVAEIVLGDSTTLNTANGSLIATSGGGNIYLAGGSGTATPTGYAYGAGVSTRGVWLGTTGANQTAIYSGGGNIVIAGQSAASQGVVEFGSGTVNAGGGNISITGISASGLGIEWGANLVANTSNLITSSSSAASAISISGVGTGNFGIQMGYYAAAGGNNSVLIEETGTGGVSLTGTATGAGNYGVQLNAGAVLAASGAIAINGGTGGVGFNKSQLISAFGNVYLGQAATASLTGSLVTSSSSNITITGDRVDTANTNVGSTGTLTVQPYGTSFSSALTTANLTLASTISGLTLGKDIGGTAHTDTITVANAVSIAGPISIYGGTINLNSNLAATASGAAILVSATSDIATANAVYNTITTNNGNISVIGDANADGTGVLGLGYKTLSAGTGNVLLRGELTGWNASGYPTISSTTGTFTFESSDASFGQGIEVGWFILPSTLSGLTIGKSTNTFDVSVSTNALSVAGPVNIYGGNIAINAGLTATGTNTITLAASVTATEGASGNIVATNLLLNGTGSYTFGTMTVGTLAATGVTNLSLINSALLSIGTVGATDGISASGTVSVATTSGNLTLLKNVTTTDTTSSAVVLNAGTLDLVGTSVDNILLSGGTVTVGTNGRAVLYTGSIANSTGVTTLVGSGSGKFRYNSKAGTSNFTSALGSSGTFAVYREQPTLTITADSPTAITYGSTPTYTTSVAGVNGDTDLQALSTQATVAADGTPSTSGKLTATTHTLTPSGAVGQLGYALSYATGSLVVNKLALTGAAIATAGSTYASALTPGAVSFGNIVGSDSVSSTAIVNTSTTSTSGNFVAGSYTQTASTTLGGTDKDNYSFGGFTSTANYTIDKLTLAVGGVLGVDKVYDANISATLGGTAAITKVGADDVTIGGTAIATFALKDVGPHAVTVSGYSLSGTDAGNYNIVQPTGVTANITAAPLVITANADAKILTQVDNTAGYNGVSYSGLVGGETSTVVAAGTVTRTGMGAGNGASDPAGTYTGVLVPGGYSSGNYNITYANGNYTIVPADQLLVKVTNTSTAYGTAPTFSITSAEYLNGSNVLKTLTQSSASGNTSTWSDGVGGSATFTLTPGAAGTSTSGNYVVGNYAITGGNTSIVGSNFTALNFVGNLAVTQLALTANASNVSKVYDGTISMNGVTLGLVGLVTSDLLSISGAGNFATKHVGSGLGYTISDLALAGADASNYYLSGGTSFSGSNGVITAAPLTLSGITASNKVYNGNATATVNTSGAIYAGLVGGDTVTVSATGVFGDRNVGIGKTVTLSSNYSGLNLTDYLITDQASTTANITQLASVTWIGGATGSWSNPANWAGGAIPDLSNVANVVIPTGSNVTFDSGVAGPVNLSQLTSGGLTVNSGTLNISDALNLQNYNQSGGLVEGAGSFTVTNAFDQTSGILAMGGDVNITQTAGNLSFANISGNNVTLSSPNGVTTLGDLTTTGTLAVTTNGGAITQSAGTSVNIGGVTTLSASNGGTPADITLANAGNIFGGAVNANGNNVALTDDGPLTLGTVTTTGNLTANSPGALNLGTSIVGGNLAANSGNGDVTQTGALAVKGTTNIVAGTGNVTLTNASNLLVGTVSASGKNVSLTKGGQPALDNVVTQLESTLLPVLANLQPPTVRVSPTITVSQASGSDATSGGAASSSESGSANKAEVNVKMSIGEMGPTLRIENGGIKLPDNIANVELSQNTNQGESDRSQGKSQL